MFDKTFKHDLRTDSLSGYKATSFSNCYGFDTTLTSMQAMFFPDEHLSFVSDFYRFDSFGRRNVKNKFINNLKMRNFKTHYYTNDVNGLNSSLPLKEFDVKKRIYSKNYLISEHINLDEKEMNFIYFHDMTLHDKLGKYFYDPSFSSDEYVKYSKVLLQNTKRNIKFLNTKYDIDKIILISDHGMTINKNNDGQKRNVDTRYQFGEFKSHVIFEIYTKENICNQSIQDYITLRDFQNIFFSDVLKECERQCEKNISYFCNPHLLTNKYIQEINTFVHRDTDYLYVIEKDRDEIIEYMLSISLEKISDKIRNKEIKSYMLKYVNNYRESNLYIFLINLISNFYSVMINKLRRLR
jgi:hypothetical protein